MLRALLSGLLITLASTQTSMCCDAGTAECQLRIRQCLSNSTVMNTNCYLLACPTPIPTFMPMSQCCDPNTQMCQDAIKQCIGMGNPTYACQSLACPTPSPSSVLSGCCDPTRMSCTSDQQICPSADMSAVPSKPPTGCCDPTRMLCSDEVVICPSADMSAVPSKPPTGCCDPTRMNCPDGVVICPSADMSFVPSIPPVKLSSTMTPVPIRSPMPSMSSKPSRSAMSTMLIKPIFSPIPTRLPIRTRLPINFTLPERIPAILSLPRANVTEMVRPEKLQEMQAKIACALRMPLENIEITNITIRRGLSGVEEIVNADLSVARLSSSGVVQCMLIRTRRLRSLQGSSSSEDTVHVTYDIITPTEEIMTADLASVVSNDAGINELAISVGGSPFVSGGLQTSSPTSSTHNDTSAVNMVGIGIGVACGFIVLITLSVMVSRLQSRRRTSGQRITGRPSVSRVVILSQENPIASAPSFHESHRVVFKPHGARV